MTRRTRVLYIAGLSRGGSTILQKYLATNPDFVSVGESLFTLQVLTGIQPWDPKWPCSCGRLRTECEFWGPLVSTLATASLESGHALVLERFRKLYPDRILIDSSKETTGLKQFYLEKARAGEIDLEVIFLVRDVRSWASAIRKHRPRKTTFVVEAYRWLRATLNMFRVLRSTGIPCYCLFYESFVFDPEHEVAKLAEWLRVTNDFSDDRLDRAATHELFGSATVRFGTGGRQRLFYDVAWLRDWGPALLGPLVFPALLLNRFIHRKLAGKPLNASPPPVEVPSTEGFRSDAVNGARPGA